jgi:hypothetical protein
VASFLTRHGKKQRMLPAFRVVHAAHARQLAVNLQGTVLTVFGLRRTHGAILPLGRFAGKASRVVMAVMRYGLSDAPIISEKVLLDAGLAGSVHSMRSVGTAVLGK